VLRKSLLKPSEGLVQIDPVATLKNDVKLITTHPGNDIVAAQTLVQDLDSRLQSPIPLAVAKAVIDLFEMIDVGRDQGQILVWTNLSQLFRQNFSNGADSPFRSDSRSLNVGR